MYIVRFIIYERFNPPSPAVVAAMMAYIPTRIRIIIYFDDAGSSIIFRTRFRRDRG